MWTPPYGPVSPGVKFNRLISKTLFSTIKIYKSPLGHALSEFGIFSYVYFTNVLDTLFSQSN